MVNDDITGTVEFTEVSDSLADDEKIRDIFLTNLALFYLRMQAKMLLPASTISILIEEFQEVCTNAISQMFVRLRKELSELEIPNERICNIIEGLSKENLLTMYNEGLFRSDTTRKTYFKKDFSYVEPVQVHLGFDASGKERFCQYVPVKDTLKALMNLPSVRKQYHVSKMHLPEDPNVLEDVRDGKIFKENTLLQDLPSSISIETSVAKLSLGSKNSVDGVKFDSVFNSLEHFHVCQPGLPPCLGHDLFEGIVSVDLQLFLKHLVSIGKHFTFVQLNRKICQLKFKGRVEKFLLQHFCTLTGIELESRLRESLAGKGKRVLEYFKSQLLKWKKEVKTVLYHIERHMGCVDLGLAAILVMIAYFKEREDAIFLLADEISTEADIEAQISLPSTPRLIMLGESILGAKKWMVSIEGRVVLQLSDHSDFTSALAVFFGSYYVFSIEYPEEAATSLEFIQRFFVRINPEQSKCAAKVQVSRRTGKMVQRKNESLNPHVASFIRNFIHYDWQNN
ncbi:hypothetical protein NFI96_032087 [Prochilodus magdalenae]|nr:hypothetical protein NFI96_032087 [Prochilodus magdalenae]